MLASLVLMAAMTVDNVLPAGNIVYERTEGDTVYVHQELRDTEGDWFYWAMRVKGAAGRSVTFSFTKSVAVGVRGPAVSRDKGATFAYAAEKGATRKSFTYTFGPDEDETWFYACIPYLPTDWARFLEKNGRHAGTRYEAGVLCTSKKGADVPMARFGCLTGAPKHRLFMTSRHHCSETMATFVLEGVAAAFLADDELGAWLRENVELTVVPFVDYDGSVAGDQGKNRQPYDHNRDYTALTHPEIRAIVGLLPKLAPDMWIDVHCPWLYGGVNEKLSTPLKDPKLPYNHPENEARFSALLEKLQCGSMRYRAADNTPWGTDWNTDRNYAKGMSSIRWAMGNLPSVRICRTYEVPFANANGAVVTGETCRELGRDTAKVVRAFLTSEPCAGTSEK